MKTVKGVVVALSIAGLVGACGDEAGGGSVAKGGAGGIGATGGASGKGGIGGTSGGGSSGASGAGGSSGVSGGGGTAGGGGVAGSGGAAGQDGGAGAAGEGGASGTAGASGSGGASGTGGTAGSGGASGASGAGGAGGDTTPPQVSSTSPSNAASGVVKLPQITVTFDEPMTPSTLTTTISGAACSGSLQVSKDDFLSCVTMNAAPAASNANQTFTVTPAAALESTGTYKIRVTVDAKDAAGNPLAAAYTSAAGFMVRYFHTIAIDGTNDFAQNETFATSTSGYTGYVAWDESFLYLGMKGADVASGSDSKWLVVYVGGSPGTTTGVNYNTQQPGLPFASRWHVRWKADNLYTNAQSWNGTSWQDAAWDFAGDVHQSGDFVELRIPLADLGAPATLELVLGMINEQNNDEWSYAALPAAAYIDGWDRDFAKYLQLALGGSTVPIASSTLP
jgi:hypothetical protein